MQSQRQKLVNKQKRLNDLLINPDKKLAVMKGKTKMTDDEKFAAFKVQAINRNEKLYGNELRAKYGEETLSTSAKKFNSLSKDEMKHVANLTQ